jgi:hypothetical protein
MTRALFILILLADSAGASELNEKVFDFLCKGGLQRRKLETSWVSKVDSFSGERLDIVQEKQAAQRTEFRTEADQKWGKRASGYSPDQVKEYIEGGKLDVENLVTYLANEYILMVPQRSHIDVYAESCLPQYDNDSEFLGYRDGQPVMATLFKNQGHIFGCMAMKNTTVLQDGDKYTARLDLTSFCRWARPASAFFSP